MRPFKWNNLVIEGRVLPEGSTYPSTVTAGHEEGTLNVSPT